MASRPHSRPISPHLGIYRWGPHMLVSILHRATGTAMATAGVVLFTWWLAALATGPRAYARFHWFTAELWGGAIGLVVGIGLTWAFFLHMSNGIRHLVMDAGANFELRGNKRSSVTVIVASLVLTAVFWAYVLGVK